MVHPANKYDLEEIRRLSGHITLTAEGLWLHEGQEITHERSCALLFKSLYENNGQWFLSGDQQPVPVHIEDTPYFVRQLKKSSSAYELVLSDGSVEKLDPATLHFNTRDQPNCLVKKSCHAARLTRQVYYELMKDLVEREGYYGLLQDGVFYPLKHTEKRAVQAPRPKAPLLRVVKTKAPAAVAKKSKKTLRKKAVKKSAKAKKVQRRQKK